MECHSSRLISPPGPAVRQDDPRRSVRPITRADLELLDRRELARLIADVELTSRRFISRPMIPLGAG